MTQRSNLRAFRRRIVAALCALALVFGAAGGATAAAAADTTNEAHAIAVQPDGKIVVAGRSLNALENGTWVFAVARYLPTGALDPAFGQGGRVVTAIGANGAEAYGVAVQPDGKIVLAGRSFTRPADALPVFALARYNPDGSLDPTFGQGGSVTSGVGTEGTARAVAVQPDGKIVAAGAGTFDGNANFAVVRYNPDGALDEAFGTGGLTTIDFAGAEDVSRGVAIRPDGKIAVAGHATAGGHAAFAVARFTAQGTPDPEFGGGGVVSSIGGNRDSEAHALALQPDGKLVAGGFVSDGFGKRFALVRYNADGSVDAKVENRPETGFNGGGVAVLQLCSACINDTIQGLALQPDGRIVAAGHSNRSGGFIAALARYNPDGTIDSSFGSGGTVTTELAKTGWANAVAVQADGGIVTAGTAGPQIGSDFALVRYTPAGVPDPAFGSGGSVITNFSGLPQ